MFKYGLLLFLFIVSASAQGYSITPLQVKSAKKQVPQKKTATTSKKKTTASKKVTPKKGAITLAKNPASTLPKKGSDVKTARQKKKITPKSAQVSAKM